MAEEKEKLILCLDATELDNFELCKFRWHMFHHRHVRPKRTEGFFEKGTFLHFLLEHYYKSVLAGTYSTEYLETIIEMGRVESLKYELTLEDVSEHLFQFREYIRYYREMMPENIIPLFVEEPFVKKLYEDEDIIVVISGKPDLIFQYAGTNDRAVMDHKKMTREFSYSPMRNQFKFYACAMETDTVIVNKVGFQKTKALKDRMVRMPFIYAPEIIEEWKEETIQEAKEMVVHYQAGYFPRNKTSCEKWNGCYLQRYCCTKPKAREFLIGNEYIIGEPWDVGRHLEINQ